MSYTHQNKNTLLIWLLLLAITLLSAQGTKLHVHFLECEHAQSAEVTTSDDDNGHTQHGKIHLATNGVYNDHSDEGMSELDVSPQGLLKNLSSVFSLLLAITSLCILLLPEIYRQHFRRLSDSRSINFWRYVLSPPLRAPPQA